VLFDSQLTSEYFRDEVGALSNVSLVLLFSCRQCVVPVVSSPHKSLSGKTKKSDGDVESAGGAGAPSADGVPIGYILSARTAGSAGTAEVFAGDGCSCSRRSLGGISSRRPECGHVLLAQPQSVFLLAGYNTARGSRGHIQN